MEIQVLMYPIIRGGQSLFRLAVAAFATKMVLKRIVNGALKVVMLDMDLE